MRAYFFDDIPGSPNDAHDSGRSVSADVLNSLGIIAGHSDDQADIDKLAVERGYKNRDIVNISRESMGDVYDDKLKAFYSEHLHDDEEIRYILDGTGYFDVRDKNDVWIRCLVEKGDYLILPPGIYHRFTPTSEHYVRAMRLFHDDPKWTPFDRSSKTDESSSRKEYESQFL